MPNRLSASSSPYLRQHAENPINWNEWGPEALAKSRTLNLPIFLSIGYSSCHWCHVMAHESFEDPEVAEVLNRSFVSIKVDREERPDIDDLYMTAVQLATGQGGWPMTLFLTPDQEPFFVGTYFPREQRGEMPGFRTLAASLAEAWQSQELEVREAAREFAEGLRQAVQRSLPAVTRQIDPGLLDQAVQTFSAEFDEARGGFGGAPKFPPHTRLNFLLEYCQIRGELAGSAGVLQDRAAHMAFATLEQMACGGIHDLVGGGFHRYSTDARWHIPHFEKVLTDNAQLTTLFAKAAAAVDDPRLAELFALTADRIVDWVNREMRTPEGFIAHSLDADSEGSEGRFYVWSYAELQAVLGQDAQRTIEQIGALPGGNFHDEASGLHVPENIISAGLTPDLIPSLDQLLIARAARERPQRDDKCLLGANALWISALVSAGRLQEAADLAEAWLAASGAALPHQIVDGRPEGVAFLDDCAFWISALCDLAQALPQREFQAAAEAAAEHMLSGFQGPGGSFFSTSSQHQGLLARLVPCLDQAQPSGNGAAICALRRVGRNQDALVALSAVLGWAQRLPTGTETLLTECLHTLLLHSEALPRPAASGLQLRARLNPQQVRVDEEGWGFADLLITVPEGCHINSHSPSAAWLEPTKIEVEGVYGEAGFDEGLGDSLSGEVLIALRLRAKGSLPAEFGVNLSAQVCTDSECLPSQSLSLSGVLLSAQS